MTYRRKGHAEHDNQSYVPAGEIERWAEENDPIDRYVARLTSEGVTQDELDGNRRARAREIDEARISRSSRGVPEPLDALEGIYADPPREKPLWFREGQARAVEKNERPESWGTYDISGERLMAEITYLEAIREALFEEMERDPNVFCIGEDIGAYGGAFKVTEG